jgi:hypothetical protein
MYLYLLGILRNRLWANMVIRYNPTQSIFTYDPKHRYYHTVHHIKLRNQINEMKKVIEQRKQIRIIYHAVMLSLLAITPVVN